MRYLLIQSPDHSKVEPPQTAHFFVVIVSYRNCSGCTPGHLLLLRNSPCHSFSKRAGNLLRSDLIFKESLDDYKNGNTLVVDFVSLLTRFWRFCRYQRKKVFVYLSEGYVALMATIIIGAVLLVMTVGVTTFGANARFTILGIEAKEQSGALAQGCADQALAQFIADSSYLSGATTTASALGSCYVFPIEKNTPAIGLVTLRVQGKVRDSFTNLELVFDMKDVRLDSTPLPASIVQPSSLSDFDIELVFWREVPSLP